MQAGETPNLSIDHDLHKMRQRFSAINKARMTRVDDCLNSPQRDFLKLLPLLFHTNHPLLPGYISYTTPSGLYGYKPSAQAIRLARKRAKSFAYDERAPRKLEIYGLYMMGSSGTIAYTDDSDFDIWVCHKPGMETHRITDLCRKAEQIEHWAAELGLEVHFFILNPDDFRQGQNQTLSKESSGSTQHYLLLDEFYRSSLVLAGQTPVWWLVPPEHEARYDAFVSMLLTRRFIKPNEVVDFGGLAEIPAEEFFGATLWQLYKSIESPYKSVMKLTLMEVYADEYPDMELLSMRYKKAVYAGIHDLNDLDPYLQMYRKVEEYLQSRQDAGRLALLRRSFYLKTGEKLTQKRVTSDEDWRCSYLETLTKSWGWDTATLMRLDNQSQWRLPTVLDERRDLITALTQSYRKLSQFARNQADIARITQTDLTILGRKLYAAFERKAGKVERINRGICPGLHETDVTLLCLSDNSGQDIWLLFSNDVPERQRNEMSAMKRCNSLLELLVWAHFNRIIDASTHINTSGDIGALSQRELRLLIQSLQDLFPQARIYDASTEELKRPAHLKKAVLFANVGTEARLTSRSGNHIASSRNNALSYGALHENLTNSFDLVLETSWEEIFTFRYQRVDGLLECLGEYLHWCSRHEDTPLPPIQIFCHSSSYGMVITQTLEDLYREICNVFQPGGPYQQPRYILEVGKFYYRLEQQSGRTEHSRIGDRQALYQFLCHPMNTYQDTVFEHHCCAQSILPGIYTYNEKDKIQLFFHTNGQNVDINILDERGALFQQRLPRYENQLLLEQFSAFFSSLYNRRQRIFHGSETAIPELPVECYILSRGRAGKYQFTALSRKEDGWNRHFLEVQVIGDVDENDNRVFTIYCDGVEFSSMAHGGQLFDAVARYVLDRRQSGLTYPVYITDIDLSSALLEGQPAEELSTVVFLNYKKNIESRLTRALQGL